MTGAGTAPAVDVVTYGEPGEVLALARAHARVQLVSTPFLGRRELGAITDAFDRARRRARTGRPDDAAARAAGEWLLDNDYLVRRVLRQLREELPDGFQRRLPRLLDDDRPRILAVAEAIHDGDSRELDLDRLVRFLTSYQETTALTIAELWALPALLRLVILRRLAGVMDHAFEPPPHPPTSLDPGSAAGRAVRALRLLAESDWKAIFCAQSFTERLLGDDPAGAYPAMDFETRDAYRHAIEEIAFAAGVSEVAVADVVLDHARRGPPDGLRDHVGHWLLGDGRLAIERAVGASSRGLARRIRERPHLTLFGLLIGVEVLLLTPVAAYLAWLGTAPATFVVALALCWIPASIPAETIVHWALARLLPPRILPKLDFTDGIPARWRTLVAVPTLLEDADEVGAVLAQLEVYHLANPDHELAFALLTDHPDSDEPPGAVAAAQLARAEAGIRDLNRRYEGSGAGPFHLLHRASRWNPAEGAWMGWERKRGKLSELNRYLRGAKDTSYTTHVGDPAALDGIAFVITLDSDTQLPAGAAARLVGTLAHPLNRPRADAEGRLRSGYTVVQPRVEVSPRSAPRSLFSRLFAGDTGIDIYTRAVSETYQDLFGEGVYVGKGIYDLDAFHRSLAGRVPDNALVSHDLFEGVHGRVALATDIVVYEDYPPSYPAYLRRMHRWVRGDWQLLPWLMPWVPRAGGGWMANRLGLLARFEIVDNLRRSLFAPALLALLVAGWFVLPGRPAVWTAVVVVAPGAAAVWSMLRASEPSYGDVGRWFLSLCLAPEEARTVLDAATRALVRMLWTRTRMLEWTTAASAARQLDDARWSMQWRRMWAGPATAVVAAGGLVAVAPHSLPWAAPWLVLWFASPELVRRTSVPSPSPVDVLDADAVRRLRRVARRTWSFFETFVGPGDHWLPPDHFQEYPRGAPAHRTSPTNVGMLLLSELAAYDLGYLGPVGLATWVSNTLDTLEHLERHRGHVYNWYDTRTLEPLLPRYVSTVDSGNLAGALLAVASGCEAASREPPLPAQLRDGLYDTSALLADAIDRWASVDRTEPAEAARTSSRDLASWLAEPGRCDRASVGEAALRIGVIETHVLDALRSGDGGGRDALLLRELRLWLDRVRHQIAEARWALRDLLPPGLDERDVGLAAIPDACRQLDAAPRDDADRAALTRARDEATALVTRLRTLAERARALAEHMDFGFLYDHERRLLHVGFDVDASRLDPHHYDLLASEARLASYLAVAWRQVPVRHWFALGRPLSRAGRHGRVLLSWGGSMFEYLMPALLMRSHDATLLHESCAAAVDRQIAYGRAHKTPWGVSESGYAFLDGQQAYQYRSFGVPGLGLRRGLDEDLVVAPYACLLALRYRPRAVVRNLVALEEVGMLGPFGYYEAADFHAQRAPGPRPALVFSYMAHHHGMSLAAIANQLVDDVMVRRFHADPLVESRALLLDERVPRDAPVEQPRTEATGSADVGFAPAPALSGWVPDRRSMQTWAIGNGRLTSLVTADGGGGLRWRDLTVTRWEPDPVADAHGTWIYLRDTETGETFAPTPAPIGGWPDDAHVRFEADRVEFHRRHEGLSIRLRITVAAAEDVEIRELEIANDGDRARRLDVVGCLEPVLASDRDAVDHPAFSKLFLRCAPIEDRAGVLVSRIDRDGRPMPMLLVRMIGDRRSRPRVLEIDRGAFLGRRGSYRAPDRLRSARGRPADATLDPVCALATELEIAPGSTRTVSLITALAPSRAAVLDVVRRFGSAQAVRWAFDDAEHATARRVERLGTPPRLLPATQRLLSALLAPDPCLRAPAAVLAAGRPSPQRLWGRGISGDDPVALVRMDSRETSTLLADVVEAHRYLRALGVPMDLIILDEAPSGYAEHGPAVVRRFLETRGASDVLQQRGGIHVLALDQTTEAERRDLEACARVHLDARAGSLPRQLDERSVAPVELPPFTPTGPPPGAPPDPPLALAVPSLDFDNGIGGFDGEEYVVRPGAVPPAPWCNVLANAHFGCLVSEASLGSTWSINARENRLTPWSNDPVTDTPAEALYLRDEETAEVWTPTPRPAGGPTLVRHGQGYTTYTHARAGLEQTLTVFVPPDDPVKIVRLRIRNATARPRRVTATYHAEWVLGSRRAATRPYVLPSLSPADACLLAETSWSGDFAGRVAFLATDHPLHGYTTDRVEMLGRGGDLSRPAALARWGLSGHVEPGVDPCAALQVHVELGPGDESVVSFVLGQASNREGALEIVRRLREPGAVETAWRAGRAYWDGLLGAVRVRTPDPAFDHLCNRWLLYQSLASRFFGRTAFYQSSGAFGFRDQLQDALAFVHCDPALTRGHLLEAAAHQFVEGDVLHWWHPPAGAGVRTHCSDDLLWLVYATAAYVDATGDAEVLDERRSFLTGPLLGRGDEPRYDRFAPDEDGTLLEHCRRAMTRAFTVGGHGLPLIGDGDWNDGMNRVGSGGKGESVWLGWFLHACVERWAGLLDRRGATAEAAEWRGRLPRLTAALSSAGWDGNWYRRAYHDDGTPIGSAHGPAPHIDSIAQSWAVLGGGGDPAQVDRALASAERTLVLENERLVLLLAPPFDAQGPDPGYIAAYPPGVRENGGQYTHAAAWLGWAHAMRGDGDAAYRIFALLNPLERTRSRADVARYGVEPYVIAADVYARPPWVGRGGWTWYTGAAAWTWRLGIEAILGLRRREGALEVVPCLPSHWPRADAWVREGQLTVHVVVHNAAAPAGGSPAVRLDGQPVDRARVALTGTGERLLEIWLGAAAASASSSVR